MICKYQYLLQWADSIRNISKIYKDLLRQRDLALIESQALDEQRTTLEKDLGKIRDRLKNMYEKERDLSMQLHKVREQEESVHSNCKRS